MQINAITWIAITALAFVCGGYSVLLVVAMKGGIWGDIKEVVGNIIGGVIGAATAVYAVTRANKATIRASFVVADLEQTNREIERINQLNDKRRRLTTATERYTEVLMNYEPVLERIKTATSHTADIAAHRSLTMTPFPILPPILDWQSNEWTVDWLTHQVAFRYGEFNAAYEDLKDAVAQRIADGLLGSHGWTERKLLWDLSEKTNKELALLSTAIYTASSDAALERDTLAQHASKLSKELRDRTDESN